MKKRLKQRESDWWVATLVVRKKYLAPGTRRVRSALYPNGEAARRFIDGNMKRGLFKKGSVTNPFERKVYEVKR